MSIGRMALLARTHLRRTFRDRGAFIWLFGMPLLFSFLMGRFMGGTWTSEQLPSFRVYDLDHGSVADLLCEQLEAGERFRVVRYDTVGSEEHAARAVRKRWATAAVFLAPGLSDSAAAGGEVAPLRLHYDSGRLSSNEARTEMETAIVRLNLRLAGRRLAADPEAGTSGFDERRFEQMLTEPRLHLAIETIGRRTEEMELAIKTGTQHIGPAYTLMFVLMFLMLSGRAMVEEREAGTLRRLALAEITRGEIALGFFAGNALVGVLQFGILLLSNRFLHGIDYGPSPACLVLVSVLFVFASSALGLALGSFCRTPAQVDAIGIAASLLMAALGGLWWPLEIVPRLMQQMGLALPTGMGITIFHDMIGRGWGVAENASLLLRLALVFVLAMAASIWRLRRQEW